jgi:hypothetical protein
MSWHCFLSPSRVGPVQVPQESFRLELGRKQENEYILQGGRGLQQFVDGNGSWAFYVSIGYQLLGCV